MTAPTKCESLRRACIYATDLSELDQLSSEATILYKEFQPANWRWLVVISHDILALVAPGHMPLNYQSVFAFNKMIESKIAAAIAGEQDEVAKEDPTAALQKSLFQQYQSLGSWPVPTYASQGSLGGQTISTSGLGQALTGWNTTSSASTP